jgi:hypothetical protein
VPTTESLWRNGVVVLCVVMLAVLMACGDRQTDLGDGKKPSNCSLVSHDEVAALIGKPVKRGVDSAMGCGYVPEQENLSHFTVCVTAKQGPAKEAFGKNPSADITLWELEGIGDEAVMAVREGTVLDVVAVKGDWAVRFNVPFLEIEPNSEKYDRFVALIKKAMGRL